MQLGNNSIPAYIAQSTNGDTASFDITLKDVWDTINPLEHIPFVSTLYDAITGSKPSAGAQLAGGALYGGPIGIIVSAVNIAFQGETGHDALGSVVASVYDEHWENDVPKVDMPKLADASQVAPANIAQDEVAEAEEPVSDMVADSVVGSAPPIETITQTPIAEILPPAKAAPVAYVPGNVSSHDTDVLSLFDHSNANVAASNSYRKAQALAAPRPNAAPNDWVM